MFQKGVWTYTVIFRKTLMNIFSHGINLLNLRNTSDQPKGHS
jgi:hypothetical protein